MNCLQVRCGGTIDGGYCDRCGLAPPHTGASRLASRVTVARTVINACASRTRPPAAPTGDRAPRTPTFVTESTPPTTSRPRLGLGLVQIAPVARRDPSKVIMTDPTVAEHRRFCGRCGSPVGRGDGQQPGRTEGFCRRCGVSFSFAPKLRPGDLVAEQYEVVGCLAHGGLGWIYLARDHNVADRWVVLKGLLNSGDENAMAAALAERLFLAEVEHPNIVRIFNFVERDGFGYIVMEYVDGVSLRTLLASRRTATGEANPLPAAHAISYVLEILEALAYLHRCGLLFCDLKLDNVMQTQDTLKLIDLGGVYRVGDSHGPVYGTIGYQAPEIERAGPSVASDLFTAARLLAALCVDFEGFGSTRQFSLPPKREVALFSRYESLYRLLCRGTALDPSDRFQSADEMAHQLYGVLREIVADEQGAPVPAPSTLFTGDLRTRSDRPDARHLPALRVATDDPAAGYLATLAAVHPDEVVSALRQAPQRTIEVELRLAQALIDAERWDELEELLAQIERRDPWEWRARWYRGVAALTRARPLSARASFERVYEALPGELAPKLALAMCAEVAEQPAVAVTWYEVVSRTDRGYLTATFGLARCRLICGDRDGAMSAYERVPDTSSAYVDAQIARVRCLLDGNPEPAELCAASAAIDALSLDREQRALLAVELLRCALTLVTRDKGNEDATATVAGYALSEAQLRAGLERTYRSLAAAAIVAGERIRLVDEANRVRPRTWI